MASISSFKDALTPELQKKLKAIKDKRPILQAMGDAAVRVSTQAFQNPSLRLKPWAKKKDGSTATLIQSTTLIDSLMAPPPSSDMIEVGSSTEYARAQNFGYEPRGLPARPFFPIANDGTVQPTARKAIESAMKAAITKALA